MKSLRSVVGGGVPRPSLPLAAMQSRNATPVAGSSLLRTFSGAQHFISTAQFASRPLALATGGSRRQLHSSRPVDQEASSQSSTVSAPEPATPAAAYIVPESFAIVHVGGRQYKVSKGSPPPPFSSPSPSLQSVHLIVRTLLIASAISDAYASASRRHDHHGEASG
jgi:hypothetical protein